MSDENQPKTNTIFLFGAGASVDAGIPDTYNFVEAFKEHVKQYHQDFSKLLSRIIKVREKFNQRVYGKEYKEVDIEQLLDTIRCLIERENDPLLEFYGQKKFSLDADGNIFAQLKELLENFIRERVIIEDESKLEYLKELLKFDRPTEIYSTNYDTCIEQLSHIHHMRYTDGFDINWNKDNFGKNLDIKHYKMHGSVIWYENEKTKECVKIPVHAFLKGEPIALKLIYGESVKPLLIYPAQKAEYVEPLTDLQLMFKERLFNKKTEFLVVVGYSFRDDYIIHMLWDAARVNEKLHVILIAPDAYQIFESKLKYINKKTKATSRIDDRVICLPYPFSTVIYLLKNHYLNTLQSSLRSFNDSLERERYAQEGNWEYLVRAFTEIEFLSKAETAFQKANKKWQDLSFGTSDKQLFFAFKGLLHSIVCKDGNEEKWLKRVNESFMAVDVKNLYITNKKEGLAYFGFNIGRENPPMEKILEKWITPLIIEIRRKEELLSTRYKSSLKRIILSLNKLEEFCDYLKDLAKGVRWYDYSESENDLDEVKAFIKQLERAKRRKRYIAPEPDSIILGVEKGRLKSFLGGESFEFRLQ